MKRILSLLTCVLLGVSSFAQNEAKFELTPNGIINGTDKDYIVIEVDNTLTQKELFEKTQTYLASRFVSPQDVISAYNENTITINWVSKIAYKVPIGKMPADVNYTATFQFKDGRVRINNPSINSIYHASGERKQVYLIEGWANLGIFDTKGRERRPDLKTAIENDINAFLFNYVSFLTSKQEEEDW